MGKFRSSNREPIPDTLPKEIEYCLDYKPSTVDQLVSAIGQASKDRIESALEALHIAGKIKQDNEGVYAIA